MDSFYSFTKEEDEDGIFYHFVTRYNFVYTVYFKIDEYTTYIDEFPLLLQKGFAFGFRKTAIENAKNADDLSVFSTLYQIINDFFNSNGHETVLLYHCDQTDGRQLIRSKLFDRWERKIENSILERHAVEVCIQDKDFYLGFITSSDNPFLGDVINEFESFSYYIIQGK